MYWIQSSEEFCVLKILHAGNEKTSASANKIFNEALWTQDLLYWIKEIKGCLLWTDWTLEACASVLDYILKCKMLWTWTQLKQNIVLRIRVNLDTERHDHDQMMRSYDQTCCQKLCFKLRASSEWSSEKLAIYLIFCGYS